MSSKTTQTTSKHPPKSYINMQLSIFCWNAKSNNKTTTIKNRQIWNVFIFFHAQKRPFFLQGENLPTSGLLSKERPIKIDHPVQVSGMPASKRVNDTNMKKDASYNIQFSFLYDQFVYFSYMWNLFSMGHSQSSQTKFRSMKVFQLVRLSWEKHAFFVKLRADDNSDAMNRL